MPTLSISLDGTILTIDTTRIHGQVGIITADNAVIADKTPTSQTSGKKRTFTGFDDTRITVPLVLYHSHKYTELTKLNEAYKKLSNNQPIIYTLDIPLAKALGVQTAIIEKMEVSENEGDAPISVTLTLVETEPLVNKVQTQQSTQQKTSTAETTNTEDAILNEQDKQLLKEGTTK